MTTIPTETQPFFTHWEYEKAQEQMATMERKRNSIGLSENEYLELRDYNKRTQITPTYLIGRRSLEEMDIVLEISNGRTVKRHRKS